MKKLLIIVALLLPLTVNAQKKGFKLVEKSNPKGKPSWVTTFRDGYFNEQCVEAPTLDEAKNGVYESLMSDIAMSVSVNIDVKIDKTAIEIINEKKITETEYKETVKKEAKLRVSRMPALQGIILTKGEIYYERYYNKKTKEEYYNYYIQYPFSRFEIEDLIIQFNAQEQIVNDRIERDKNVASNFTKTDDIETAMMDLDMLANELGEDDLRLLTISNVKNLLKSSYKKITIEVVENKSECVSFNLVYDNRVVGSSLTPKMSSNCAEHFDCTKNDNTFVVKYNDEYCYNESGNYIKIVFNFKGNMLSKNVYMK